MDAAPDAALQARGRHGAHRPAARAEAAALAEVERQAAAVALQVLPCEDCGQEQAGGLCEVCGYRRQTGALTVEAGLVAAAWSADLDDSGAVAAVLVHVRATLQAAVRKVQDDFLGSAESGEVDADPLGTASVLAFGALQAVQEAVPAYRRRALAMLGRSDEAEAEAEARRAYRTEQGRRWFRHNPNGADALAAATKAADAARERTAQFLLAARVEWLREQAAARAEQAAAAPWTDRLPELAARPLDGAAAGAVIAWPPS
ncbi:hypothetical protein ACFWB1_04085 [Streptomyces goshikiensis]|uniref:hypothetical protein n=1 Tax=Streptomyces TaxID=1883 RepID=UPI00202A1745|nr:MULTISPECIES: hypothetical protein [unclassified Streptomyces]